MPTSEKHRKARVNAKQAPGQTWTELDTLYHTCLNQVAAVCEIGPILKLPLFGPDSPYHADILRLGKDLNTKAKNMVTRIENLHTRYSGLRTQWDSLSTERKTHRKAGNKEAVEDITTQMDGLEFKTFPIGEGFFSWQTDWTNDVIPTYLELSDLMSKTRENMGDKNGQ